MRRTITKAVIIRYIFHFVVMLLLAMSSVRSEYQIVHTAYYIALIFVMENPLIYSVEYILAGLISSPTLVTLGLEMVPVVIMSIAYLVSRKVDKRPSMLVVIALALLSLLPMVVVGVLNGAMLVDSIIAYIFTAIFTYLSIIALDSCVKRRLKVRLMVDEVTAIMVIIVVMSMGLYNIDIFSFRIYYIVMSLISMLMISIFPLDRAFLTMIAFSLGGGISSLNISLTGIILVNMAISSIFVKYNRYFMTISYLLVDILFGMYFLGYSGYDYLHIIAVAVGLIIFLLIPRGKLEYYKNIYDNKNNMTAIRSYVNRNRIDINAKITNLSKLFHDIESELTDDEYILTLNGYKKALSERIMCEICGHCNNRDVCMHASGGDMLGKIEPIVEKATMTKASIDDIDSFFALRCKRTNEIVDMANDYSDKYANTAIHICDIIDNKRILGEQIGSLSHVLDTLSTSILDGINFDRDIEEKIREELAIVHIDIHDVLVARSPSRDMEITLVVSNKDKDKKIILDRIEKLAKVKMIRSDEMTCELEGYSTIRLVPRAKYMVSYGISKANKEGSSSSGDTESFTRIDENIVAIALSDGKGSGERANKNSASTISIIEKMYKAGFDTHLILSFVNRLLSIRNNEDFTALDMAVIDLRYGEVDFIKLGGVTTYIKRESGVDIIEGSALPIGVLEEAKPSIERRLISDQDVVIMLSDGITDAIEGRRLHMMISDISPSNLDNIANEIATKATENGAIDDSTVIAFKISKV